jgi:hypothetical protein
MQHRPKKCYY